MNLPFSLRAACVLFLGLWACGCQRLGREVAHPGAETVWLDVDCAAGLFTKDVDDGLALIQAFNSPELSIRGISVVYGNAPLEQCLPITIELTDRFGPAGIRVLAGAASPDDLGRPSEATEGLIETLEKGPLTILALGPVTTVATVVRDRPDLHGNIRRIVVVAGRRPGQEFRTGTRERAPLADFNFERDPEAMQILLDTGIEVVMAPWEVSSRLCILQEDLDQLARRDASAQWIAEKSQPWLLLWQRVFRAEGFNPFDTLAVGYVTHPELFESFEAGARIEEAPDDVAAFRYPDQVAADKPYLYVRPDGDASRRIMYVQRVDVDRFKPLLLDRMGGPEASTNETDLH